MTKLISGIFVLAVLFMGFSFAQAADSKQSDCVIYSLKKGDTMWGLAKRHYGKGSAFPALMEQNRIKDPRRMRIGTVIKLPNAVKIVKGNGKASVYLRRSHVHVNRNQKTRPSKHASGGVDGVSMGRVKTVDDETGGRTKVVEAAGTKNAKEGQPQNDQGEKIPTLKPGIDAGKVEPAVPTNTATSEQSREHSDTEKSSSSMPVLLEARPVSAPQVEVRNDLNFNKDDVMPEDAPEARSESHEGHDAPKGGPEHQLSLKAEYSANKADKMKSVMLDYMAWAAAPSLNKDSSFGAGAFANIWEDRTANARIRAIMPGAQLAYKYNRHTENHLMRMFNATLMGGYEFQSVKSGFEPVMAGAGADAMNADPMQGDSMNGDPSGPEMNGDPSGPESSLMANAMRVKAKNSFKLGAMLEYHYQLTPKSTLELMNVSWYSPRKADMSMEPSFSLIASHVYSFGDWHWRIGLGPQYEDWTNTWRLHLVPAEIAYKNLATVGVYGNIYPWEKGGMYKDFSRQDLTAIGVNLRFNIGADMHKGHRIKDR